MTKYPTAKAVGFLTKNREEIGPYGTWSILTLVLAFVASFMGLVFEPFYGVSGILTMLAFVLLVVSWFKPGAKLWQNVIVGGYGLFLIFLLIA